MDKELLEKFNGIMEKGTLGQNLQLYWVMLSAILKNEEKEVSETITDSISEVLTRAWKVLDNYERNEDRVLKLGEWITTLYYRGALWWASLLLMVQGIIFNHIGFTLIGVFAMIMKILADKLFKNDLKD